MKVYTASKLSDGPLWRRLAAEWPEIEFTARWPFYHVTDTGLADWPEDCPAHGAVFWQHDNDDVAHADVVLVYTTSDKPLKGALVEVGMALAMGKPVIVVGSHQSYPTWWYHSLCRRVKSLDDARSLLRLMSVPPATDPQDERFAELFSRTED